MTATTSPPTERLASRRIAWIRRRRALADLWRRFRRDRPGLFGLVVLALIVLMAVAAPLIADPARFDLLAVRDVEAWQSPNSAHWFGTDDNGRDIFAMFVHGSRVSLLVGLTAAAIAIVIGSLFGLTSGYTAGSWLDRVLNRVTEWFLVIPFLPLAIVLVSVLDEPTLFGLIKPGLGVIVFVIGITSWPGTARVIRAQVLSVKERLYVDRARALGANDRHVITRHILPNVTGLIVANATLTVPITILTESTLSFLGLGDPTRQSWGRILNEAKQAGAITRNAWWYYLPAGVGILLVVLAFTLIGQALETILNPKLRERES